MAKLPSCLIGMEAYCGPARSDNAPQTSARNIPDTFDTYHWLSVNKASTSARVLYSVESSPVLIFNNVAGRRMVTCDPPEIMSGRGNHPLNEGWGVSGAPYALAAGVQTALLASAMALHAVEIDLNQTMNVSAWRTRDGAVHILAGNLEGACGITPICRLIPLSCFRVHGEIHGRMSGAAAYSGRRAKSCASIFLRQHPSCAKPGRNSKRDGHE